MPAKGSIKSSTSGEAAAPQRERNSQVPESKVSPAGDGAAGAGEARGARKAKGSGKITELQKRLKEAEERHLRLLAEYDNHIKRTTKEKQELATYGGTQVIRQLLPVLDDLRRTLDHLREAGKPREEDPMLQGLELVYDKFTKALEGEGVKAFSSVGMPFDPELHEALMSRSSDDHPAGIVLEDFEPGYRYRNKVIRHAKVVVSS